jgi:transcriptional regulator with XRE-family HTH domain
MAEDDQRELRTTPLWRQWMVARREQLGLTQTELGRMVGVSQPIISHIENGVVDASVAVEAISDRLGIPPPYVAVEYEDEKRLIDAGRALRSANRDVFVAQLQLLETLAKSVTPKG